MAKKRFAFEEIGKEIFIRVHLWSDPKDKNPKRVWLKDETGRKKRFKDYTTTQMTAIIRELGGGHARKKVQGKTTFMWWIPYTRKEEKSFAVPDLEERTEF